MFLSTQPLPCHGACAVVSSQRPLSPKVPEHLTYDDFWARYFFRAEAVAKGEAERGGMSFPRDGENKESIAMHRDGDCGIWCTLDATSMGVADGVSRGFGLQACLRRAWW